MEGEEVEEEVDEVEEKRKPTKVTSLLYTLCVEIEQAAL